MRTRILFSTILCAALLAPLAARADDQPTPDPLGEFIPLDLAALPRDFKHEMKLEAAPYYALLILDNAGKARCWSLLFKTSADAGCYNGIYMDLNADGAFDEATERFVCPDTVDKDTLTCIIPVGDLPIAGSTVKHTEAEWVVSQYGDSPKAFLALTWCGTQMMFGGATKDGEGTTFGADPATAPVLRPTMYGDFGFILWSDAKLNIGQSNEVKLVLGNAGSGADTLFSVNEFLLALGTDDTLQVTVIGKDAAGKEVRETSPIREAC